MIIFPSLAYRCKTVSKAQVTGNRYPLQHRPHMRYRPFSIRMFHFQIGNSITYCLGKFLKITISCQSLIVYKIADPDSQRAKMIDLCPDTCLLDCSGIACRNLLKKLSYPFRAKCVGKLNSYCTVQVLYTCKASTRS